MAVRVEKPAFNLRDKLSKLELPVGVHGSQILKSETPQDTFKLVGAGRKNMIINGDMRIAQRSSSVSNISTTDKVYTADRFKLWIGSAGTYTNSITTINDPDVPGFRQGFKLECTSAVGSLGSSSSLIFSYNMERHDTIRLKKGYVEAEYITVSFYVKSSITGRYVLELYDNVNTRHVSKGYTINRPNVWEYKTITYPPDFDGRIHPANTLGISFYWWLVAGTTYSNGNLTEVWQSVVAEDRSGGGTANISLTSGATWEITGIQAEVGKVATEFDYLDYATQLSLCQRYYWKLDDAANTAGEQWLYMIGSGGNGGFRRATVNHPVPMRGSPSVTNISLNGSGSASGVQFNGTHTTTIYINGAGGGIVEVEYAEFDSEF